MSHAIRYVLTEDDTRIAYSTAGSGPPLVFVRGWISHIDEMMEDPAFRAWIDAFASHFTVWRFDMRGNGLSDHRVDGRTSLDELVLDLEAIMHLVGEPVTMVATCYGGPIAMRYLTRHPDLVSSLVLDGTFATMRDVPEKVRESVLSSVRLFDTDPAAAVASIDFWTAPEGDEHRTARMRRSSRSIDPAVAVELYEHSFAWDMQEEIREISTRCLVLHRRGNRAIPFAMGQRVAGLLPDAEFVPLEGTAANPWEGDPLPGLQAIADFLGVPVGQSLQAAVAVRPVAVLFSDVVGSTAVNSARGDRHVRELMRVHEQIIDDCVRRRYGVGTRSTGDGTMVALPSATAALEAALAISERVEQHNADTPDLEIPLRLGVNVGEAISDGDEVYGLCVAIAARICDMAGSGEILVSSVVRDLVFGARFEFEPVGTRALRGVDRPVEIHRLVRERRVRA